MRSFADLDLAKRSPDFADFVWRAANIEQIPIAQGVKPATESKFQIPSNFRIHDAKQAESSLIASVVLF